MSAELLATLQAQLAEAVSSLASERARSARLAAALDAARATQHASAGGAPARLPRRGRSNPAPPRFAP